MLIQKKTIFKDLKTMLKKKIYDYMYSSPKWLCLYIQVLSTTLPLKFRNDIPIFIHQFSAGANKQKYYIFIFLIEFGKFFN